MDEHDATATMSEPEPAAPPPAPPEESSAYGFVILAIALLVTVLFLQRSRKSRNGEAEEKAPPAKKESKTEAKGEARTEAKAEPNPPPPAVSAAALYPDGHCQLCGSAMDALTWRGTERMWLLCCGKQMCSACHSHTTEKIREASVAPDEGQLAVEVPLCPPARSSFRWSCHPLRAPRWLPP